MDCCDLAISAVASDGGLVAELSNELSARLTTTPEWSGTPVGAEAELPLLLTADRSRVVLVLHQHLWQRDAQTRHDADVVRTRAIGRRGSVCVLALDDSPAESWLARAPRYDLAQSGRAGVIEFVVRVVATKGGEVRPEPPAAASERAVRWPEPPPPFLAQPRAHSTLRREFDGIIACLRRELDRARTHRPEQRFELHVLPHRVIAHFHDLAISFSWMAGGRRTVSDGRLLVIAWRDVASVAPGGPALMAAVPFYEREYIADGDAPDHWCWRTHDLARQPYAGEQLVADWFARVCVARGG